MMKRIVVLASVLTMGIVLFAQNNSNTEIKEGTVFYDQTVKLEIKLEGESAQFANVMPKEQHSKKVLYFNDEAALYENMNEENNAANLMEESEGMVIEVKQAEEIVYTDLKKKTCTEQREFMTRLFLIEQQMGDKQWKLTGNQKKVLDYACQEAIMEKDGKKVTAWFTPSIALPYGPKKYGGLPGLIIALDINDSEFSIVATSVDINAIEKNILEKPTKGKKVTEEEFKDIVAEKMEEMGADGAEGGVHQIMIKISQ